MAGLNVGDVETRVSFRYDGTGADKFERKEAELRRKAGKPITQSVHADTGRAVHDFDQYDRKVRDVDASHAKLARGSGRLRGAMGTLFIGGAGVAAGGLAFAGLAKGVLSANSAFEESAKISAQTHAVLKSTGGAANVTAKEVSNLAGALSRKTGIDDEVIQSGENMLLTFTNVRNEVGRGNDIFSQATRTITDMSVALGQDTSSSAIQLGKALNDPIKGVTALQRVGVTFTKQQKEQIATLVAHGKKVEAQKLILHELNKEFGGSAAAQATWSSKLAVTWGNVQEAIGAKLAPALQKAGSWLNGFLNDLLKGGKTAGQFTGAIRSIVSTIRGALAGAFGFIGRVVAENRKTIDSIGATFSRLWGDVKRYVGAIGRTLSDTFGSGSGTGRDIRQIIRVVGQFAAAVLSVYETVVRRALPGIIAAFRGLAQIVRGVIKVISGILTLDFAKVWDGVKDIFGGAVKAIGGILRAGTAPIRAAASAIGHAVVHAVSGLPGALLGIGKKAVSSLASGLSGIPHALVGAFKGGASFLGGIGRGIADWLNAHTPFGDKVKVGPISIRLPALWRGGRVGPGAGGPRVFIAGEGNADEWVISQEGDRRQNVSWAREALEALTGRRVGLHAKGKAPKRRAKPKLVPKLKPGTNAGIRRSTARGESGIKDYERDIQRMERQYDQKDREYGMTEEEFVIENDDGSATLNEDAVSHRLSELRALHALRARIADKYASYKNAIGGIVRTYTSAIRKLTGAINAAKGKARGKERAGYVAQRQSYRTRVAELRDVGKDLDLDLQDQWLDTVEIENEQRAVSGSTSRAAPAAAPGPDDTPAAADDAAGAAPGSSSPGDASGADAGTTVAPPSASEIAAAALAEFASFNAARASLFSSFGGNSMTRGGLVDMLLGGGGATLQGAGLRAFGAAPASGPTTINLTNYFGGGPAEPGTWASQQRYAIEAQLG